MEGHLLMSASERRRLIAVTRVVAGEMTVRECARSLDISERTAQRLLARYRSEGDAGLVHRSRGKPSGRQTDPALRQRILRRYRECYCDFGPTLGAEVLADDGLQVNPETLRLWLIQEGLWQPRKSRRVHRSWRERKACFGELVQLDGSVHGWFEDRGPRCFLMNMVDDATGHTLCLFAPEESTLAAMQVTEAWIRQHGIPAALYTDRKNVYVTDRQPTPEEVLRGQEPLTQFGRACHQLGIRMSVAHSPQAKGRVERMNGTLQSRFIKLMRLRGIGSIEQGNAFLKEWLPRHNARFQRPARSTLDMHRALDQEPDLKSIFCRHELRSLQSDWTVRFQNQWMQVLADNPLPKQGSRITVECRQDGSLRLSYKGQPLTYRPLPQRPERPQTHTPTQPATAPAKPTDDHPWRKPRSAIPEPWRIPEEVAYLAAAYLAPWRSALATD